MQLKAIINTCFFLFVMAGLLHMKDTLGAELKYQVIDGNYKVLIPSMVNIKIEAPLDDFVLYKFYLMDEEEFLTLYIGNQPEIEGRLKNAKECENVLQPNFSVQCGVSDGKVDERMNHVYAKLKSDGWPQYAHFSYKAETCKKAELIRAILLSFNQQP